MNSRRAFTLVEIMLTLSIIALLATGCFTAWRWGLLKARIKVSSDNLHQLALANLTYAADNAGSFCPAQDERNLIRWHGGRDGPEDEFDPRKGFLSPYFARDKRVQTCPLLKSVISGGSSFEDGAGGYGYNATYVGGSPGDPYSPAALLDITAPSRVVMFATTAFSKKEGLQEYPFAEPHYAPGADGESIAWHLQPSVHFRAGGQAIVAWCDGHITLEDRGTEEGMNLYGGDNAKAQIGWFGPSEANGYWNPHSPAAQK